MRIVHFADVHLDRPFVGLPRERARERRLELFEGFRHCLSVAKERDADVVTIGGDLWEDEHVTSDTRASVAHELGALGLPVLAICGNHDPLFPGGAYARTEWPENVTIVRSDRPEPHEFDGVMIWGVSWTGGHLSAGFLDEFRAPEDERTHVLLLHGTAVTLASFADGAHCPFDPARARNAGFSVCLAGHLHAAGESNGVVYPGSPEPLGWGTQGRHCVAVVDIEPGRLSVELVDINEKRYETREVDCTGCNSSAAVRERLEAALADSEPGRICLRVRLTGELEPECEVEPAVLHAAGAAYAAFVIDDTTVQALDVEAKAGRPGLDGIFVRKLRERIDAAASDDERKLLERALEAGLRAIERREVILRVD